MCTIIDLCMGNGDLLHELRKEMQFTYIAIS